MAKDKLDQFKHEKQQMEATISFKDTHENKKEFQEFCKKHGLKSGKILRKLLSDFMSEHK